MNTIIVAVLPVMAVVALGYIWARTGRGLDRATLTPLVSDLGVPALAFVTLARLQLPFATLGATALAAGVVLLASLAASAVALRLLRLDLRTYLPALTFPNVGNLGLSLMLSSFGQIGLSFGMIMFTVFSIANNTLGRSIAAGEANWKQSLLSPILPAVALGLLCTGFRIAPPEWLMTALTLVGGLALPLMLLMLGASLATIRITSMRRALLLSALRLGFGAAIGLGVAALFGFTGAQRAAIVLQSAMPVAVINYLFADLWDREPQEIASLVVISTLLSVITTPLLLGLLLAS